MEKFASEVEQVITSPALGYDQKLRRLAALAVAALPYPELSPLCAEALDARVICDMYEGNRPFTPRYVLPDYALALRQGVAHLELEPPTTLDDALAFLTILYSHVPSVTTYPVYLGDLDALLEPFVPADLPDAELDDKLRRFWIGLDRMLPDAFVHANVGPADGRVVRAIWRVERSLRQVVPNLTLKVDPDLTPDDLIRDAVETVFVTGKPHFANHPMMVADHGPDYAVVSCYNSLKVRGGAHSLVRLNLLEAVRRHVGGADSFCAEALPHWVELTCELGEARIRSLVEQQGFFRDHFLAREGLVELDRFSLMFGVFGLAECVNELMSRDGATARYGHDRAANEVGYRITRRLADLVGARPLPYCGGGGGFAYLHSQSGIDLDLGVTAGTRVPIGDEPPLLDHLRASAPHHVLFPAGISDIVHVDETVRGNPAAVVDLVRGSFAIGMRDFTFNLDSNEFIRITGYLVRKSDLVDIDDHGARHSSDYLAATAEVNHTVTTRRVQRVGAVELAPPGATAGDRTPG
jgi:YjjI family glycine radical enzyme